MRFVVLLIRRCWSLLLCKLLFSYERVAASKNYPASPPFQTPSCRTNSFSQPHAYSCSLSLHTITRPFIPSAPTTANRHYLQPSGTSSSHPNMGLDHFLRRPSIPKASPKHFPSLSTDDCEIYAEPAWPRERQPYVVLLSGFIMMMNSWCAASSLTPRSAATH